MRSQFRQAFNCFRDLIEIDILQTLETLAQVVNGINHLAGR
jgi:hypothetical protein